MMCKIMKPQKLVAKYYEIYLYMYIYVCVCVLCLFEITGLRKENR